MAWLRSLGRYMSRAKLVGTDLAGNQYFEKVVQEGKAINIGIGKGTIYCWKWLKSILSFHIGEGRGGNC